MFPIAISVVEAIVNMAKLVVCPHEEPNGESCGFETSSDDEEEVITAVQKHAATEHALDLSRVDVEQMMQHK